MKKTLSFILIVAFIFSLISTTSLANSGDSATVYAVADKSEVVPGDTLTVTLKVDDLAVDGSEESKGLQFRFDYDSDVLEITGKSNGSVLRQANTKSVNIATVGQIGVMAVYSNNISVTSGDLATLTFTVKSSAAAGQIDFELLNSQGAIAITFGSVPDVMVEGQLLPALSVSADKERVLREEELTYSFDLSKVTDFRGIQFDFDYDESKLKYVSSIQGEIFDNALSGGVNDDAGKVTVVVVYDSAMEFEGNICAITFEVKADAQNGEIQNEVKGIKTTSEIDDTVKIDTVEVVSNEEDKTAADAVITKIDAIGEVTIESGNAIEEAEIAYAALTDAQKALVTNIAILIAARETYDSFRTVNFETGTTTKVDSIVLKVGDKIIAPTVTKDGYELEGWYSDREFSMIWDFENDTVTENITLYAKWEPIPSEPEVDTEELIDSGTDTNGVQWYFYDSGLLKIEGTGAMQDYSTTYVIPWYGYKADITEIIISDGITHIGARSFYNCVSATKITIPNSVGTIGIKAFSNCEMITIYCEEGTYAETYAIANNIPYVSTKVSGLKEITVDFFESAAKWYFGVEVANYGASATVYVATYDINHRVLETNAVEFDITDVTTIALPKNSDAKYANIFVWNNNLQPITEKKTIEF